MFLQTLTLPRYANTSSRTYLRSVPLELLHYPKSLLPTSLATESYVEQRTLL